MLSASTGIYRIRPAADRTERRACQSGEPVAVSHHRGRVPDPARAGPGAKPACRALPSA